MTNIQERVQEVFDRRDKIIITKFIDDFSETNFYGLTQDEKMKLAKILIRTNNFDNNHFNFSGFPIVLPNLPSTLVSLNARCSLVQYGIKIYEDIINEKDYADYVLK